VQRDLELVDLALVILADAAHVFGYNAHGCSATVRSVAWEGGEERSGRCERGDNECAQLV
jgi:hypothetical protein